MDQSTKPNRFSLTSWLYVNKKAIFNCALRFLMCGLMCALLSAPSLGRWELLSVIVIFLTAAPFVGILSLVIGRYLWRSLISASLEHTSKYPFYF